MSEYKIELQGSEVDLITEMLDEFIKEEGIPAYKSGVANQIAGAVGMLLARAERIDYEKEDKRGCSTCTGDCGSADSTGKLRDGQSGIPVVEITLDGPERILDFIHGLADLSGEEDD